MTRRIPDGNADCPGRNVHSDAPPEGPIWAGILAAGIGGAALGALVDASEASKNVSNALSFYTPAGDLSGKTVVAVVVWLAAWATLQRMWKNHNVRRRGVVLVAPPILILSAIIALFPPFFEVFAAR